MVLRGLLEETSSVREYTYVFTVQGLGPPSGRTPPALLIQSHHLQNFSTSFPKSDYYRVFDPSYLRLMATIARHIRSYYDPETEQDDLLLQTGQVQEPTSSVQGQVRGGIGFNFGGEEGRIVNSDSKREEGVDPWLIELPYAPPKFNAPLKFVKSVLSYEDVNDYIERGHESGLFEREKGKGQDVEEERNGISNWYRNLSRTNTSTPVPAPVQEENAPAELAARSGTLGHLISPSGANDSGIATQERASDALFKPQESPSRSSNNLRRRNDWFIPNILPRASPLSSGSTSPAPGSRPPPTLADMLARDPPPHKPHEAYTPPPWIMLPPSNPGFRMLQKSGWSEGEPLGPYFSRKQDIVNHEQQPVAGPSNHGKRKDVTETRTTEVEIEGYDDIVEVKKEQVIDLTVSDDEETASSDDEDTPDEGPMELDDEAARSSDTSLVEFCPTSAQPMPLGEGHGGKALLTPLPTVLKSDRLGIGLKAKTVGPYKASQKRVTHNTAALAAHIRAHEERKSLKRKVGRGSRGFSRAEKRESEKRKNLLTYLNQ